MTRSGIMASLLALAALPVAGQQSPLSNFVLTGYGTTTYGAGLTDMESDFSASISPVILFSMGDDLLFEAELEFEVEGAGTQTVLEYAQLDYLGFDRFQFSVGKFLLPFGVFGERLHPSWINKLPTMPLLYGHAHGGQASGALLPVLSDAGILARYSQPLGGLGLDVSVYVTQGPQQLGAGGLDPDGHAHAEAARHSTIAAAPGHDEDEPHLDEPSAYVVPPIGFGVSFPDNNKNKLVGARVGLVSGSRFEIHVSGFHAMYDDEDFLDLTGADISLEYRTASGELRTEVALLRQEFGDEEGTYRTLSQPGYYVQYAHRLGAFEPVARWSHLLDGEVDGSVVAPERRELVLGVDYWIKPSVPVKLAWGYDPDREDRLIVQLAFGF